MNDSLILTLCEMQANLFVLSRENGYASESFIKTFMHSATARDLDKPFHHMQWAGEHYLLSRLKDENGENHADCVFDVSHHESGYGSRQVKRHLAKKQKTIKPSISSKKTLWHMHHKVF